MNTTNQPAGTWTEWAAASVLAPAYVYPLPDESEARERVDFYAEHYPEKSLRVMRRTVTIGPWEPADDGTEEER